MAPKSAMNPASVCAHPIVGQSQSCVPCFSACSGHAGTLWCNGQFSIPACSDAGLEPHESAVDSTAIATTCHVRAIAATRRARLRTICMITVSLLLFQPGVQMPGLRARGAGRHTELPAVSRIGGEHDVHVARFIAAGDRKRHL